MYEIILIGTIHSEKGNCNSEELYKILEDINPDIIFDELPDHFSDMYYSDSFDTFYANSLLKYRNPPIVPLEVKCNKKYKQNYNVEIIPVDIDARQDLTKHKDEFHFMLDTFCKNEDYIKLHNEIEILITQEGFHFLNSKNFLDFSIKKQIIEKNIIDSNPQKNRLLNIYNLFHLLQYDNRENAMLTNIYSFCNENKFTKAVFFIGAEHRNSIIKKITKFDKLINVKLNWIMYGDK